MMTIFRPFSVLRRRRKAFLSSTSRDLAEWRNSLAKVLEGNGLQVIAMEDFPALGKGAGPGSTDMVGRCDVLVGIYARRYGTLGTNGKSITEQEYDAAQSRKIPCLCFILDDNADWPPELTEGEPGRSALQLFKDKVRSQVIVAGFEDLEELKVAAEAAAVEYLQKEKKRRRLYATAIALTVTVILALFALTVLRVSTKPHITLARELDAPTKSDLKSVAVDEINHRIAVGNWDGEIYLWESPESGYRLFGKLVWNVKGLAFAPAGDFLIGIDGGKADQPSRLICWSVPQASLLWQRECPPTEDFFSAVALGGNGTKIAVGSRTGVLRLFDQQGQLLKLFPLPSEEFGIGEEQFGHISSLSFSPDGTRLAVAYFNGVFAVLDIDSQKITPIEPSEENLIFTSNVCFASNDDLLMTSQVKRPDQVTMVHKMWVYNQNKGIFQIGESDNIYSRLVPVGANRFVVSSNWSGEIALWNVRRRDKSTSLMMYAAEEKDRMFFDVAYQRPSSLIVGITENKVLFWHLQWLSLGNMEVFWQGNEIW